MSIKDIIKLVLKARKYDGVILICKEPFYVEAVKFGNCTNSDINYYTKGFETSD